MFQRQRDRHRQVLVVENEPVTAMALSAELRDHGLEVAGPFACRADALGWLGENQPDYAILDVGLMMAPASRSRASYTAGAFRSFSSLEPRIFTG